MFTEMLTIPARKSSKMYGWMFIVAEGTDCMGTDCLAVPGGHASCTPRTYPSQDFLISAHTPITYHLMTVIMSVMMTVMMMVNVDCDDDCDDDGDDDCDADRDDDDCDDDDCDDDCDDTVMILG